MKKKLFLVGICIFLISILCINSFKNVNAANDKKIEDDNSKVAFKIFNETFKQHNNQNILISPTSIYMAMLMAYNGAQGNTKNEIAKALEIESNNLLSVNKKAKSFLKRFEDKDSDVKIEIANSLWARDGSKTGSQSMVKERTFKSYVKRLKNYLFAQSNIIDFDDAAAAANKINAWVSKKTNDKIKEIIIKDQIDKNLKMVLVNAVYFKGEWTNKFETYATCKRNFYSKDGAVKCDMMSQQHYFQYYGNDNLQAINLPYGKEQKQSMYIILPSKDTNIDDFMKNFDNGQFNKIINQTKQTEVVIQMPKFKFENTYDNFVDILGRLGIEKAFDGNAANFRGMSLLHKLFIDKIIHKTYIDVTEDGTEAAAVTSIQMKTNCVFNPIEPVNMTIDRPFFFAIRDNTTSNILFMGVVRNPNCK